jgi:hypothetical protein
MLKRLFQVMLVLLPLLALPITSQAQSVDIAVGPYHLGDDDVAGFVSARSTEREFKFNLGDVPQDVPAELILKARGVNLVQNKVLVNGRNIGAIPTTPRDNKFLELRMFFNSNKLHSGENTLVICSRNSDGKDAHDRDDFEVKDIQLCFHPGKQAVWGQTIHLGDENQISGIRGVKLRGKRFSHTFDLSLPRGSIAKLSMDVYDVNENINTVVLNGVLLGTLPGYPHKSFKTYSFLFDAALLKDSDNMLEITAGIIGRDRDDLQFRNITLEFIK